MLVPLAVVAVLLLPWAARITQRRRRLARTTSPDPREAAAAAWAELSATCADLDLAWPASRTPRQVAVHLIETAHLEPLELNSPHLDLAGLGGSRLASSGAGAMAVGSPTRAAGSPAADALRRLALTTERARYARTSEVVRGLSDDVIAARAGLLASVDRKRRLRAQLAPMSLLSSVGARTADTLDWVDAAPRRATRVLRPRRRRAEGQAAKAASKATAP